MTNDHSFPSPLSLKERLVRFYKVYNPSHIAKVDQILDAYDGDDDELFEDLVARYGPEPEDDIPVASQLPNDDAAEPFSPHEVASDSSPTRRGNELLDAEYSPDADIPPRQDAGSQEPTAAAQWQEVTVVATEGDRQQEPISLPSSQALRRSSSDANINALSHQSLTIEKKLSGSMLRRDDLVANDRRLKPSDSFIGAVDGGSPLVARRLNNNTSVVSDAAFSPTRRRISTRLGNLFAGSRYPVGDNATDDDRDGTQNQVQPSVWSCSDDLVATTTAVVYRKDPRHLASSMARKILDKANGEATVSDVARTIHSQYTHAAQESSYHLRLQELSTPVMRRRDISLAQQQERIEIASRTRIPPEKIFQQSLNVDEVGSYRALQRNVAAAGSSFFTQAEDIVSKPVGGLYADPAAIKKHVYQPIDTSAAAEDRAERLRRQLRTLITSPLVAQVRTQNVSLLSSIDSVASMRNATSTNDRLSGANDEGAVDMICVKCGYICKVVPGREREAAALHSHH